MNNKIKPELIGESFLYTNEDGTKSMAVILDMLLTTSWRNDYPKIMDVKYKITYIYHWAEIIKLVDLEEIKGIIED